MSPTEYAVKVLRLRPYDWQASAMESVAMGTPTDLLAANGSGKTAVVVAALILWFLDRFPKGKAVITSGSFRQIEHQLFPAIRAHQICYPEWSFLNTAIQTQDDGFAFGFSTNDPGRAEGWHPIQSSEIDPVMIIVDEAKTVENNIFESFERCTRRFELHCSTPGAPQGQFFSDCTKRPPNRHLIKATSADCPHIAPEKVKQDIERYGEGSALVRSMHFAEFTEDEGRLILSPTRLGLALESQPVPDTRGEVVGFCDFAAGGDENALAVRRGNTVRLVRAWREKDTMQAAREFMNLFNAEELRAGEVWGDADGLGTVMIDALAELGFRINRFHGGRPAEDKNYFNQISESWFTGCREIERGRVNITGIDETSAGQLTDRFSEQSFTTGKLRAESKDKMAARGAPSPDRGDAILNAIYCGARLSGAWTASTMKGVHVERSDFSTREITF